jgi:nucleoside-diphosphate-sugar epimerase
LRVFVAGATGAIGSPLVATLIVRRHEVTGTTRSVERARALEAAGATPKVVDALDREAVKDAVAEAVPDVIVHELTAIPPEINPWRFDNAFAQTNRLRTEGTDHLIAAAEAAAVRRFVAQSFAAWPYARRGSWVKTEDDPLDDDPPAQVRRTVDAIRHLEQATLDGPFDGLALRYGWFYGPGSGLERTGPIADTVRRRRFPIVGSGEGVWSFIHLADAAEATALAVERGAPGVYNVTDDEPATVRDWLPAFADAIGAPPPRHVPVWLGRLFGGELGVTMMTELRGASNEKAKRELGWQLTYPSWEQGFRDGLGRPWSAGRVAS